MQQQCCFVFMGTGCSAGLVNSVHCKLLLAQLDTHPHSAYSQPAPARPAPAQHRPLPLWPVKESPANATLACVLKGVQLSTLSINNIDAASTALAFKMQRAQCEFMLALLCWA